MIGGRTVLRAEQNKRITQTGSGKLMGKFFRRYWFPALLMARHRLLRAAKVLDETGVTPPGIALADRFAPVSLTCRSEQQRAAAR
jgi:hypothetical protein